MSTVYVIRDALGLFFQHRDPQWPDGAWCAKQADAATFPSMTAAMLEMLDAHLEHVAVLPVEDETQEP